MNLNHWNLITKHLTGEISSEEKNELLKWTDKSPVNAGLLKKAEKLWELSGEYNVEFKPDKKKGWEELKARIMAESADVRVPVQNRFKWIRVAAAVLLIVGTSFVLKMVFEGAFMPESAVYQKPTVYSKPIVYICVETTDSTNVFYLPDSTKIWLNKNSSLLYPEKFVGELRDVNLNGEAFFEVVSDTANPFIVYAGNMQIKVLGTSFNVKAYEDEDEVEVIVVEGKVEFSSAYERGGKKVNLEADEKATYKKKKSIYIKEKYKSEGFKLRLKGIGKKVKRFIRRISKKLTRNKKKNKKE